MATGVSMVPTRALAAPATDSWLAGGNTGINTDGSNYLGTRNVAPLVFKTAAVDATPTERMRITPAGLVGIGTTAPGALVEVNYPIGTAVRAQANGTAAANTAVQAIVKNGRAVRASATGTGIGVRAAAVSGQAIHASSTTGNAVLAQHTAATGAEPGVLGETNSRSAAAAGVVGRVNPTDPGASSGVWGINNGTGATGVGVWGSHAGGGYGLYGTSVSGPGARAESQTGVGVAGAHTNNNGTAPGVLGETSSRAANAAGVLGRVNSTDAGASAGVHGIHRGLGVSGVGVWGAHEGSGYGVYGTAVGGTGVYGFDSSNGVGVYGTAALVGVEGYASPNGFGVRGTGLTGVAGYGDNTTTSAGVLGVNDSPGAAGYFSGRVHVSGTLSKTAGSFRIDHPLDPERQWLSHSFVESPDMMNVYNGNVVLGKDGTATVELPDYFARVEPRLPLPADPPWRRRTSTCTSLPRSKNNRFTVAGGPAGREGLLAGDRDPSGRLREAHPSWSRNTSQRRSAGPASLSRPARGPSSTFTRQPSARWTPTKTVGVPELVGHHVRPARRATGTGGYERADTPAASREHEHYLV